MKIVLEGTSSSGKSSIIKKMSNKYKKVELDDIFREKIQNCESGVKNKYYTQKQRDDIFFECVHKKLAKKVQNLNNFIIDIVSLNGKPTINKYLPKDVINVLVYTNLSDLVANINKRKNYDPRGKFVFEQFAKYYIKTTDKNKSFDSINLKCFIKDLYQIKYEFESKDALIKFAKNIFKSMDISNDKDHYIRPRYSKFNIILSTKGKTLDELKNILDNI